jgi:hypothetical protein
MTSFVVSFFVKTQKVPEVASVSVIRLHTKIKKPQSAASIEWGQSLSPDKSDKSNATERTGFIFFAFCGMRQAEIAYETLRLLTECHENGKSEK